MAPNYDLSYNSGNPLIFTLIKIRKLQWVDHIHHMEHGQITKMVIHARAEDRQPKSKVNGNIYGKEMDGFNTQSKDTQYKELEDDNIVIMIVG